VTLIFDLLTSNLFPWSLLSSAMFPPN